MGNEWDDSNGADHTVQFCFSIPSHDSSPAFIEVQPRALISTIAIYVGAVQAPQSLRQHLQLPKAAHPMKLSSLHVSATQTWIHPPM